MFFVTEDVGRKYGLHQCRAFSLTHGFVKNVNVLIQCLLQNNTELCHFIFYNHLWTARLSPFINSSLRYCRVDRWDSHVNEWSGMSANTEERVSPRFERRMNASCRIKHPTGRKSATRWAMCRKYVFIIILHYLVLRAAFHLFLKCINEIYAKFRHRLYLISEICSVFVVV